MTQTVAMPSWRDRGEHPDADVIIAPDLGRARNNSYMVYVGGQPHARRPSLAEAKATVESTYGPQQWVKVKADQMPHHDPVWGATTMFNDAPYYLVVEHLTKAAAQQEMHYLVRTGDMPTKAEVVRVAAKTAAGEDHSDAQRLYGKGIDLWTGYMPFPVHMIYSNNPNEKYRWSKDALGKALASPHFEDFDPRELVATQGSVTKAPVKFYIRPGNDYERTGVPFADPGQEGNQRPVVYVFGDGTKLILSGHHRAVAALLKGEPLNAIRVDDPGSHQARLRDPAAVRGSFPVSASHSGADRQGGGGGDGSQPDRGAAGGSLERGSQGGGGAVHAGAGSAVGERREAAYGEDLIARGLNLGVKKPLATKIANGTVTAQDFVNALNSLTPGRIGVWWGIMGRFGDISDFEDYAWGSGDEELTVKKMLENGDFNHYPDIDAECQVVLIAKRPTINGKLWDPETDNPLEMGGLMGNSYLPDGQPIDMVEIRYDGGWGWKSLNAQGIRTHASKTYTWDEVKKGSGGPGVAESAIHDFVRDRTGQSPEDLTWTLETHPTSDHVPETFASPSRITDAARGYRDHPEQMPPVVVLEDEHGERDHLDGWHRLIGAERNGIMTVPAYVGRKSVKTAAVTTKNYDGEIGNDTHITSSQFGTIDPYLLANLKGARGEQPGEHRNRQGKAWDDFVADVKANGVRDPIFVVVDWGKDPVINEGNHRRDAAIEAGLSEVPVEIRYFGHAERQHKVAATEAPDEHWRPTNVMYGVTQDHLDPRIFYPASEIMRDDVRAYGLNSLDAFWRPKYGDWTQWAVLYLAGSGASYWWSGDSDLDFLIGVDLEKLRAARPANKEVSDEDIIAHLNHELITDLRPSMAAYQPDAGDKPMEVTYFVNPGSYDIRQIHPYAAYNVSSNQWVVRPPEVSEADEATLIPDNVWRMCEQAAREAEQVLSLSEPYRTAAGIAMFDWVHEGRQVAYSPNGQGWLDPGNVIYRYLEQHPRHLLRGLYLCKHPEDATQADIDDGAATHLVTAVAAVGPYYHGTKADLMPGDLIVPNRPASWDPWGDQKPRDHVYFSSRRDYVVENYGPNVYEVEPTGDFSHDPEYDNRRMFMSPHPLKVVRRVSSDWGAKTATSLSLENIISVAEQTMERGGMAGQIFTVPSPSLSTFSDGVWGADYKAAVKPASDFINRVLTENGHRGGIRIYQSSYDMEGAQAATDGMNSIQVKRNKVNALTLLHECAHILLSTPEGEGHSQKFVDTVAGLYSRYISPAAAEQFLKVVGMVKGASLPWHDTTMPISELRTMTMAGHRPEDLSGPVVDGYVEQIRRGEALDPIFVHGTPPDDLYMTDGHHRLAAGVKAGLTEMPVRIFDNTTEGLSAGNRALFERDQKRTGAMAPRDRVHFVLLDQSDPEEAYRQLLATGAKSLGHEAAPFLPVNEWDRDVMHSITKDHGFSFHDHPGDGPQSGYMVSVDRSSENVVPIWHLSSKYIADYMALHQAQLADPTNYLGGWVYKGNLYLDISKHVPDRQTALDLAKQHHQLGIYDLGDHETVMTDSGLAA